MKYLILIKYSSMVVLMVLCLKYICKYTSIIWIHEFTMAWDRTRFIYV